MAPVPIVMRYVTSHSMHGRNRQRITVTLSATTLGQSLKMLSRNISTSDVMNNLSAIHQILAVVADLPGRTDASRPVDRESLLRIMASAP
jgi:hypothetical protein